MSVSCTSVTETVNILLLHVLYGAEALLLIRIKISFLKWASEACRHPERGCVEYSTLGSAVYHWGTVCGCCCF